MFARPGSSDKDMKTLSDAIEQDGREPGWQDILKKRGWLDLYQPHDQFVVSLKEEGESTAAVLKS